MGSDEFDTFVGWFHRHRPVVVRVRTARQLAREGAIQSPQVNPFHFISFHFIDEKNENQVHPTKWKLISKCFTFWDEQGRRSAHVAFEALLPARSSETGRQMVNPVRSTERDR